MWPYDTEDEALTESGQLMGTLSYMAPEQALGRRADVGPAVDVYAAGAMLYHVLAGRAPYAVRLSVP